MHHFFAAFLHERARMEATALKRLGTSYNVMWSLQPDLCTAASFSVCHSLCLQERAQVEATAFQAAGHAAPRDLFTPA